MPRLLEHVPRAEARAVVLAVGVAVALTGVKFTAYFLTGSAAVFSDALESIVNVAAALFATYSLHVAHTPADASHPYGHGKIEFVSAGFEGGMILLAALAAVVKALGDLVRGPEVEAARLDLGLGLMLLALAVNGSVGMYLLRLGRQQGSATLEADGHHLMTDAVTSVVAVGGLAAVRLTGWTYADPLAALVVSAYIARVGVRLVRSAGHGLMDRQDEEDERLLRRLLDAHVGPAGAEPRVCSYHKLRHRHSGRYHWVDFHLVVPRDWSIARGHEVATLIERELEQALGEGDATAHVEPCTVACDRCGGDRERLEVRG